jgi:hypothetical protein
MQVPPPTGLPVDTGLAFDTVTLVWGVTGLVMLAGLALLLWALRSRERETYHVRCPTHGTEARITVLLPRGTDAVTVESCSLCDPPTHLECGGPCAKQVA